MLGENACLAFCLQRPAKKSNFLTFERWIKIRQESKIKHQDQQAKTVATNSRGESVSLTAQRGEFERQDVFSEIGNCYRDATDAQYRQRTKWHQSETLSKSLFMADEAVDSTTCAAIPKARGNTSVRYIKLLTFSLSLDNMQLWGGVTGNGFRPTVAPPTSRNQDEAVNDILFLYNSLPLVSFSSCADRIYLTCLKYLPMWLNWMNT